MDAENNEHHMKIHDAEPKNPFWDSVLKIWLSISSIVLPCLVAWSTWTTSSIYKLQARDEVFAEVSKQIGVNTPLLAKHDLQLAAYGEWRMVVNDLLKVNNDDHKTIMMEIADIKRLLTEIRINMAVQHKNGNGSSNGKSD